VDWSAKAKTIPVGAILKTIGAAGLATAVLALAYVMIALRPPPQVEAAAVVAPQPVAAALPAPAPVPDPKAREALAEAHTAYFERRRVEAAKAYARVLEMDDLMRHDSGLAANLVGTLGYAGDLPVDLIRKYPSPEFIFELGRRTGQPGRKGAQRAAALLSELGQAGRIDQRGMALTDLSEAPSCEERLAAVKKLRVLRDPRALPMLRESVKRAWFREDRNACLRAEARETIGELEKLVPETAASR